MKNEIKNEKQNNTNIEEIKSLLEETIQEKHLLEISIEKLYLPLMIFAVATYKDKSQEELKGICEYIGMDFEEFKNMIKFCKVNCSNDLKKFEEKNNKKKSTKNNKSKVGYGKPPVETRFQKGNEGNPKGRKPKKDIALLDLLADEMVKRIAVNKKGKKKYFYKKEIVVQQMLQQLMTGARVPKNNMLVIRLIDDYVRKKKFFNVK